MVSERTPLRVAHEEPITIRPSEPIIVGPAIYLGQETGQRAVSTCVPTSITNAAIGLGVISPEEAYGAYQRMMDELLTHKDLWSPAGNLIVHDRNDSRLADIAERHLPIRLGYQDEYLGRMMLVAKSFGGIVADLNKGIAHVISNRRIFHSFASIRAYQDSFYFIDPMQPALYQRSTQESFQDKFGADSNGWVDATLVFAL